MYHFIANSKKCTVLEKYIYFLVYLFSYKEHILNCIFDFVLRTEQNGLRQQLGYLLPTEKQPESFCSLTQWKFTPLFAVTVVHDFLIVVYIPARVKVYSYDTIISMFYVQRVKLINSLMNLYEETGLLLYIQEYCCLFLKSRWAIFPFLGYLSMPVSYS